MATRSTNHLHKGVPAFVYGSFAGGMGILTYTAITTVLWYGGTLVIRGEMKPGTLVSFLLYTIFIASALGALTGVFGQLMTAVGSSDRLFEILDLKPVIQSTPNTGLYTPSIAAGGNHNEKAHSDVTGDIKFENVNFSYPSRKDIPVLKNVSFHVKPGETVAICGQSGAGRYSNIALREILLANIRFHEVIVLRCKLADHAFLHSTVSLVSQEPILFATSIRKHSLWNRPRCAMEELIAVAEKANAHNFIMEFPEGYDTLVESEAYNYLAVRNNVLRLPEPY